MLQLSDLLRVELGARHFPIGNVPILGISMMPPPEPLTLGGLSKLWMGPWLSLPTQKYQAMNRCGTRLDRPSLTQMIVT